MNRSIFQKILLLLILVAMFVLGGCATGINSTVQPGTIAEGYLTKLASLVPRTAGTETEVVAGSWIQATLEDLGYTVTREPFDYNVGGVKHPSANIIAVKAGKTKKTVILGAHYDSIDAGDGVDDNASGIAVLLQAANLLKDAETPQTIQFIFFGAEEPGLFGSAYHVSQMTPESIANTVLMMNYDSLVAGDNAHVYGDGDANGKFRDRALEIAIEKGNILTTQPGANSHYPAGTTGDWSDHVAFKKAGIPYVYFESTNWALGAKDGYTQVSLTFGVNGEIWHTKFDTMDYIKKNFPGRIEERLKTFSSVTEGLLVEDLSKLK